MSSLPLPHLVRWRAATATTPARRVQPRQRPGTLEPGERILLRAADSADAAVVATDRALHLADPDLIWRRVRWTDIDAVGWDPDRRAVVLRLWPDSAGNMRRVVVASDRRLASLAAEVVSATQVLRRRVQLSPSVGATITAVRDAQAGGIRWRVDLAPPTAAAEPGIAAAAERALVELRGLTGC
jgi:hypothetical protein